MEQKTDYSKYGMSYRELYHTASKIAEEYKGKYVNLLKKENETEKEMILELLPILDDFERGYKMSEDKMAIELIYRKFATFLKNRGVDQFGRVGENFDPEKHNAIFYEKINLGGIHNTIISKVEKSGYTLNGKIIRHADVVVTDKNY